MSSNNGGKNRCVLPVQNAWDRSDQFSRSVRKYLVCGVIALYHTVVYYPLGLGRRVGKTDPTTSCRGGITSNSSNSHKGRSLQRVQVSKPHCSAVLQLIFRVLGGRKKYTTVAPLILFISLIIPGSVVTELDLHVLGAPTPVWGLRAFTRCLRTLSPS